MREILFSTRKLSLRCVETMLIIYEEMYGKRLMHIQ